MSFTFHGSQELTYPYITVNGKVLVATPGESYDLDAAPDSQWDGTPVQTPVEPVQTPVEPEGE